MEEVKRRAGCIIILTGLLLMTFHDSRGQDATLITPRKTVYTLPSDYPMGLYLMDTESQGSYQWIFDAGVLLGIQPTQSNFRHVQLIIDNDANRIAMRGKNGRADQWLEWKHFAMRGWVEKKFVKENEEGSVGIGTENPTSKLTVNGTAKAKEVIVEENVGADFVFEEDYTLPDLSELESFIQSNKHLPEIPSAEQMKQDGVKMGQLQMKLLQKIEELTLYVIALKKENRIIKKQLQKALDHEKK